MFRSNFETVISPKIAELGKPVWRVADIAPIERDASRHAAAEQVARLVTEKTQEIREELKDEYGLTARQIETQGSQQTAAQRAGRRRTRHCGAEISRPALRRRG